MKAKKTRRSREAFVAFSFALDRSSNNGKNEVFFNIEFRLERGGVQQGEDNSANQATANTANKVTYRIIDDVDARIGIPCL
ncbi:MAG: hypothetical protein ACLPN1_10840 [Dissulfurispiraceae bacterium]|jgi:hypothetical protein